MGRVVVLLVLGVTLLVPMVHAGVPVTLQGSRASILRQNNIAEDAGYRFAGTAEDVRAFVAAGVLVPLTGNAHYALSKGVSAAVARPEMRLFIERLAAQYHEGTGEKLVVTSLTRPTSAQPKNASEFSVHPAGIAVDLRVSKKAKSRQWLESVLLKLERKGLLDVTRERWPPHYHVALFPEAYTAYVQGLIGPEALAAALAGTPPEEDAEPMQLQPLVVVSTALGPEDAARQDWHLPAAALLAALAAGVLRRRLKRF